MMCAFVRTKWARTNRREKNRFHKICYLIQVLAELAFHISSAWHKGAKITAVHWLKEKRFKCVTTHITCVVISCLVFDSIRFSFYFTTFFFLLSDNLFHSSFSFHWICQQIFAEAQSFYGIIATLNRAGASLNKSLFWIIWYYKSVSFWGHLLHVETFSWMIWLSWYSFF